MHAATLAELRICKTKDDTGSTMDLPHLLTMMGADSAQIDLKAEFRILFGIPNRALVRDAQALAIFVM